MADPTAQRRTPRPVADAPIGSLADGSVVAKAWLLALVEAAPLSAASAVPAAALAADGPALCAAVLEALGSEAALDRLRPGGDRAALAAGAARLAGAADPAAAVAALEALRAAAWDALGSTDAQLAIRLAHVCATVLEGALAAAPAVVAEPVREPEAPPEPEPHAVPPAAVAPAAAPLLAPEPEFVIHDARHHGDVAEPWRAPIERRLERQLQDGRPFSVLAMEIDELDRLLAAATGREVVEAIESAERGICGALRPGDILVRERLGRYWLTAPETDLQAGRALGQRLADAVSAAAQHHGAPLTMSIGLAVCPDDALDADMLAAHADEGLFAARAAGVRLA